MKRQIWLLYIQTNIKFGKQIEQQVNLLSSACAVCSEHYAPQPFIYKSLIGQVELSVTLLSTLLYMHMQIGENYSTISLYIHSNLIVNSISYYRYMLYWSRYWYYKFIINYSHFNFLLMVKKLSYIPCFLWIFFIIQLHVQTFFFFFFTTLKPAMNFHYCIYIDW